LKCDGTHAETRFRLSAKRTSPFKSAGASFQLTTGSQDVHISGSNAGYTMFRGSVKSTGYPFAGFPFTSPPARHCVPSLFDRTVIGLRRCFNSLQFLLVGFQQLHTSHLKVVFLRSDQSPFSYLLNLGLALAPS